MQSQISIKRAKLAGLNNELQRKNLKVIKKSDINFYPQNITSPRQMRAKFNTEQKPLE